MSKFTLKSDQKTGFLSYTSGFSTADDTNREKIQMTYATLITYDLVTKSWKATVELTFSVPNHFLSKHNATQIQPIKFWASTTRTKSNQSSRKSLNSREFVFRFYRIFLISLIQNNTTEKYEQYPAFNLGEPNFIRKIFWFTAMLTNKNFNSCLGLHKLSPIFYIKFNTIKRDGFIFNMGKKSWHVQTQNKTNMNNMTNMNNIHK